MDDCHPAGTLLVASQQAADLKTASLNFKSYSLEPRQLCDLELLLSGAYAPLTGYLGREDCESVLETLRLADGAPWAMGAMVALELGLRHPEVVDRLVAYGAADDPKVVTEAVDGLRRMSGEAFMAQLFPRSWWVAHPDALARLPKPAIAPNPDTMSIVAELIEARSARLRGKR